MKAALLLALLLAFPGCGGGAKPAARPLDVSRLPGEAPAAMPPLPGGTFIWGRSGDAVKLDPALVTDGESVMVTTNLFDTLVGFKPGTTEIVPWLALRWEASRDGLVWTFHLREGVRFHDGTALDAEAVAFSFERQRDAAHPARRPDDAFLYYETNFRALQRVEAVDAQTVRFTLGQPYAPFLSALALHSCAIVSPAAFARAGKDGNAVDFSSNPVGSGPFVFERWERDAQIVLRANKEHWAGAPPIDKLIFRPIKNAQARLQELAAGSIHGMDNPALEDLATIQQDPRMRLLSRPGINVCYLAMNTLKKPYNDVRVRQAVATAIDKRRIVQAAYNGIAEPAVSMCPSSMAGHATRLDRKPDPKRARELLAAAGYADGFTTTLWYPAAQRTYLPDPGGTAIQIQQDLKEVGITVELRKAEWSAHLQATQAGEHDLCLLGWMADIFDPDNFLYVLLDKDNATPPAQNVSFYRGDRVHNLLVEAQRSYDWPTRAKLYEDAQAVLFDEVPALPLATVPDFRVVRMDVRGYTIYPAGGEYFRHVSFAK